MGQGSREVREKADATQKGKMEIRKAISLGGQRLRKGMCEREPAGNSELIKREGQGALREGSV